VARGRQLVSMPHRLSANAHGSLANHATASRSDASSFLTLPTRRLTRSARIRSEGQGFREGLELGRLRRVLAQPFRPGVPVEDQRHAVVDRGDQFVGRTDDDGAGADAFGAFAVVPPVLPEPGEHEERLSAGTIAERPPLGVFSHS
jgi:hypothetical protein